MQFEGTTPEQVAIRKKFFFQKSSEKKDNYVIEMDVDLENQGTKPYQNADYFVALGSAAPIPSERLSFLHTAGLVHLSDISIFGGAKGIDVGWFGSSSGFLGLVGQRAARPIYQEPLSGAEWVAVSNQFFTTLLAPLNATLAGKISTLEGQRRVGPELRYRALTGSKIARHRGGA